jgi:hypothetical protein
MNLSGLTSGITALWSLDPAVPGNIRPCAFLLFPPFSLASPDRVAGLSGPDHFRELTLRIVSGRAGEGESG